MPVLLMKHTGKLTARQSETLHRRLADAVEQIFHKQRSHIMVSFEAADDLWLGDRRLECGAFLELKLFGTASDEAAGAFIASACEVLKSELGIDAQNVHIACAGFKHWGYNGRLL